MPPRRSSREEAWTNAASAAFDAEYAASPAVGASLTTPLIVTMKGSRPAAADSAR